MGQIISLKYDLAFKYLFLNLEVRRHFISHALAISLNEIREMLLANTFLLKALPKAEAGYRGCDGGTERRQQDKN